LALALACGQAQAQEQAPALDRYVGQWSFRMTWADTIDDRGTISAKMAGQGLEMICTDGCNTRAFLRAGVREGRTVWEFWPEAGVQSGCAEDKGWRVISPVVSPDGRRIDFWYLLQSSNCSGPVRSLPEKYSLTRQ
jgi:hypothetical protein